MTDRTDLITGLRDLAAFLETNPSLPTPSHTTVHNFPSSDDDNDLCAAIDQIATHLGTVIDEEKIPHGHYATSIRFGPVEYKAVAILSDARSRYAAETSYRGCVQPE
ncbi:hypothetical protein GCM10010404_27550 [Nonomuraea africana]|uniref:Uncharacterized protein n=1 Tax=Nonomuraea africana TaxID=46171 RepID=A0ABR9KPY4_9ACTN|nr:hypothetical protein [Nonomuraea africana]MBE1563577.1 hypothetical protein [Nonomuraea africana]